MYPWSTLLVVTLPGERNELSRLSFGLEHSFVNKNKNIKTLLAASLESVAEITKKSVKPDQRENLYEFLSTYTDIFSQNVTSHNVTIFHTINARLGKDH